MRALCVYYEIANMTKVFKHREFNKNTKNILCNSELWFSSPKYFNDPFDGQIEIDILLDKFFQSQKHEIDQRLKDVIFEYYYNNKNILYGIAILSLNQSNSDIVVWSHYADKHRGLCFEFELEGLRNDFIKPPYDIDADVNYHSNPIDVLNELSFDSNGEINESFLVASICRALWECKHTNWQYENEIRFFLSDKLIFEGKNGLAKEFNPNNLTSIYYGIRTPKTTKQHIHEILKDKKYSHVQEFQMNRVLGEFKFYEDENIDYDQDGDGWET